MFIIDIPNRFSIFTSELSTYGLILLLLLDYDFYCYDKYFVIQQILYKIIMGKNIKSFVYL